MNAHRRNIDPAWSSAYHSINPRAVHTWRSRCYGWLSRYFGVLKATNLDMEVGNFGILEPGAEWIILFSCHYPSPCSLLQESDSDVSLFACGRLMCCDAQRSGGGCEEVSALLQENASCTECWCLKREICTVNPHEPQCMNPAFGLATYCHL